MTALECVQIGDAIYCQCGNPSAHYGTMGERGARVVKCEPPPPASLPSKNQLTKIYRDAETGNLRTEKPRHGWCTELYYAADVDALLASLPAETECRQTVPSLLDEFVEKIEQWAKAYPLDVFPEPDHIKAHEALRAAGILLDNVSASAMRHVITRVRDDLRRALKSEAPHTPSINKVPQ